MLERRPPRSRSKAPAKPATDTPSGGNIANGKNANSKNAPGKSAPGKNSSGKRAGPKGANGARAATAQEAAMASPHGTAPSKRKIAQRTLPAVASEGESDTRGRILRTAEALFAEDGFDAVSMRDITTAARVNLASVNYHFGSKMALLADVVSSRANILVEERLALLAGLARDRSGRPKLEAVITAFLRPALEMSTQPGGAHHMRLRARLAVERIGMTKSQFEQIFDASNQRFVDALCDALPGCPRAEIYWGFHCLLGVVVYTMANSGRIQHLSDATCDPRDVEAMLERVVPFIAQGFRAIARRSAAPAG